MWIFDIDKTSKFIDISGKMIRQKKNGDLEIQDVIGKYIFSYSSAEESKKAIRENKTFLSLKESGVEPAVSFELYTEVIRVEEFVEF